MKHRAPIDRKTVAVPSSVTARLGVMMTAALLTACASLPLPFQDTSTTPPARPAQNKSQPSKPQPSKPQQTAAVRPDLAIADLPGMSRDRLRDALGAPTSESVSSTGLLWRYTTAGCTLSVAFFPEVQSGIDRVLGTDATGATPEACLKRLQSRGAANAR